ncbi:MAG TPA: hypothetical protein VFN23_07040 [Ktedonobacteraceae bacterium]|nr:hypothetical protein [Ktedonobacteraceae bacterium]
MFQHPIKKLELSPSAQALIATAESLIISAVIAALIAASQYLSSNQQVNFSALLWIAGVAALLSLGHGIAAYFVAKGNQPLGEALDTFVSQVQTRIPAQPISQGRTSAAITAVRTSTPPQPILYPPVQAAPPALSTINLADTRHFGDTGVMPTTQPPAS